MAGVQMLALSHESPAAGSVGSRLPLHVAVARELRADWPLHALVAAYVVAAMLLAHALDRSDRLTILAYAVVWLKSLPVLGLLWLALHAVRSDPRQPARFLLVDFPARLKASPPARPLAGLLLVCTLSVFYGAFTSIKNMLPALSPFWADRALADFDALLHGGSDPWLLLQPWLSGSLVTQLVEFNYAFVWMLVLFALPAFIAMHPGAARLRRHFFLSFFLSWILLGSILAAFSLSGGPVYYSQFTGDGARFAELLEFLASQRDWAYSATRIQAMLWELHQSGTAELASGISAFPSMHVATATLFALAGWQLRPWLGLVLAGFAVLILAGSVHLGWHYAVDGYASILGAAAIWWAVGRMSATTGSSEGPVRNGKAGQTTPSDG